MKQTVIVDIQTFILNREGSSNLDFKNFGGKSGFPNLIFQGKFIQPQLSSPLLI